MYPLLLLILLALLWLLSPYVFLCSFCSRVFLPRVFNVLRNVHCVLILLFSIILLILTLLLCLVFALFLCKASVCVAPCRAVHADVQNGCMHACKIVYSPQKRAFSGSSSTTIPSRVASS